MIFTFEVIPFIVEPSKIKVTIYAAMITKENKDNKIGIATHMSNRKITIHFATRALLYRENLLVKSQSPRPKQTEKGFL